MTTRDDGEVQEPLADEGGPRYWIDPVRFEELNRSLELLLVTRRCSTCLQLPINSGEPPAASEQIRHIVECCANEESFIKPSMPLQEIVFRIILAQGNVPVSLSHLHYQLTEKWATPGNPMNISPEGLKRVLDGDDFYGFREEAPANEDEEQVSR